VVIVADGIVCRTEAIDGTRSRFFGRWYQKPEEAREDGSDAGADQA
jgi:hypothetical protein